MQARQQQLLIFQPRGGILIAGRHVGGRHVPAGDAPQLTRIAQERIERIRRNPQRQRRGAQITAVRVFAGTFQISAVLAEQRGQTCHAVVIGGCFDGQRHVADDFLVLRSGGFRVGGFRHGVVRGADHHRAHTAAGFFRIADVAGVGVVIVVVAVREGLRRTRPRGRQAVFRQQRSADDEHQRRGDGEDARPAAHRGDFASFFLLHGVLLYQRRPLRVEIFRHIRHFLVQGRHALPEDFVFIKMGFAVHFPVLLSLGKTLDFSFCSR